MTTMEILLIGGGGMGGDSSGTNSGGGAGAGGYVYDGTHIVSYTTYTISVGIGGQNNGDNGGDSIFDTLTAFGGGFGGNSLTPNGGNGGCGGGSNGSNGHIGGTGSQGGNGGSCPSPFYGGGGGAGAFSNGSNGTPSSAGGLGGVGIANSITGVSVTYANGGNAGNGTTIVNAGTDGLGNGGDGGNASTVMGGVGGSGTVIISYITANYGDCVATGNFTKYIVGSNTVFIFTGNGTFTVNPIEAPSVTTVRVFNVVDTSASVTGDVTSDGGSAITQRGVCWNTSANPTTSNSISIVGGTVGLFNAPLLGLSPSTTYYARAYAINAIGTTYGSQIQFTTSALINYSLVYPLLIYSKSQIGEKEFIITSGNQFGGFSVGQDGYLYAYEFIENSDANIYYYDPTNPTYQSIFYTSQWIPVKNLQALDIWYDAPPQSGTDKISITVYADGENITAGTQTIPLDDITPTNFLNQKRTRLDVKGFSGDKCRIVLTTINSGTWRPIIRDIDLITL